MFRILSKVKIKKDLSSFFKITTGVFLLTSIFFTSWLYLKTPKNFPLILHTNPLGVNFLGSSYFILFLPFLGIFFISLNYYLARYILEKEPFLRLFLFFVNMVITFLIFLICFYLYFINR